MAAFDTGMGTWVKYHALPLSSRRGDAIERRSTPTGHHALGVRVIGRNQASRQSGYGFGVSVHFSKSFKKYAQIWGLEQTPEIARQTPFFLILRLKTLNFLRLRRAKRGFST